MSFWYVMAWKKYAQFGGRSCRAEFWTFTLIHLSALIALATTTAIGMAISRNYGEFLIFPLCLYVLASLIPNLSVTFRRLHDTGTSGWFLLLFCVLGTIPLAGTIGDIVLIVILCLDSDQRANQYGPCPKFRRQTVVLASQME